MMVRSFAAIGLVAGCSLLATPVHATGDEALFSLDGCQHVLTVHQKCFWASHIHRCHSDLGAVTTIEEYRNGDMMSLTVMLDGVLPLGITRPGAEPWGIVWNYTDLDDVGDLTSGEVDEIALEGTARDLGGADGVPAFQITQKIKRVDGDTMPDGEMLQTFAFEEVRTGDGLRIELSGKRFVYSDAHALMGVDISGRLIKADADPQSIGRRREPRKLLRPEDEGFEDLEGSVDCKLRSGLQHIRRTS